MISRVAQLLDANNHSQKECDKHQRDQGRGNFHTRNSRPKTVSDSIEMCYLRHNYPPIPENDPDADRSARFLSLPYRQS